MQVVIVMHNIPVWTAQCHFETYVVIVKHNILYSEAKVIVKHFRLLRSKIFFSTKCGCKAKAVIVKHSMLLKVTSCYCVKDIMLLQRKIFYWEVKYKMRLQNQSCYCKTKYVVKDY